MLAEYDCWYKYCVVLESGSTDMFLRGVQIVELKKRKDHDLADVTMVALSFKRHEFIFVDEHAQQA